MKKPNPMHAPELCEGTFCPFHNPSDHHMKDWPITVRYDKYGLTERLCVHGVGHPDVDSVAWLSHLRENGTLERLEILDPPPPELANDPDFNPNDVFTTHGCDLCCFTNSEKEKIQSLREHADTHDLSAEMENGHWENE